MKSNKQILKAIKENPPRTISRIQELAIQLNFFKRGLQLVETYIQEKGLMEDYKKWLEKKKLYYEEIKKAEEKG